MRVIVTSIAALFIAQDSYALKEGRYVETMVIDSATASGMHINPALFEEYAQEGAYCLSAEEAAKPALFFMADDNDGCSQLQGRADDGLIDLTMRCKGPEGQMADVSISGFYGGEQYTAGMFMSYVDKRAGPVEITMSATGTFDGPCRGDEEE